MKGTKRKRRKGSVRKARSARLPIGIAVSIAPSAAFLMLTALAYLSPQTFIPLDAFVRDAASPLQTYGWVQLFLIVTAFGGGIGVIVTALAFATVTRLEPAQIIRLAAVLGAVAFACRVVKAFTERARPDAVIWLDPLPSFSFPSAHASSAGALFGFIALYVYKRTGKLVLAAVPLLIAVLVGMSRVVLGAHHFTDVVGGFLLAGAVLAGAVVFPFEKLVKKYG